MQNGHMMQRFSVVLTERGNSKLKASTLMELLAAQDLISGTL